jgi:CheY-like chemotaxis protein
MHGGSVEARSAGAGQGSEFIIRLPASPPVETPWQPDLSITIPHDSTTCRILVVDDVIDTANSLAELLSLLGHEVQAAYDGASALNQAREFRPDVILLDIGLPGINGLDVARQIRRDPALEGTVLVALTGYAGRDDIEKARISGFDKHLAKPVNMTMMQQVLNEYNIKGNLAMTDKLRLLIAEDSKDFVWMLVQFLSKYPKIEVVGIAHNGQQAIEMMRQTRPDILLLDIVMPGVDGIGALRRIRAENGRVKVFIMSALEIPNLIDAAKILGVEHYFVKPFDFHQMVKAMLDEGREE